MSGELALGFDAAAAAVSGLPGKGFLIELVDAVGADLVGSVQKPLVDRPGNRTPCRLMILRAKGRVVIGAIAQ